MTSSGFNSKGNRVSKISMSPKLTLSPWNSKYEDNPQPMDKKTTNQKLPSPKEFIDFNDPLNINDFVSSLPEVKTHRKKLKSLKKKNQQEQIKIFQSSLTTRAKVEQTKQSDGFKSFRKIKRKKMMSQENSRQLLKDIETGSKILIDLDRSEREFCLRPTRKIASNIGNYQCEIGKKLEIQTQSLLESIRNAKSSKKNSQESAALGEIQQNGQYCETFHSLELKKNSTVPSTAPILERKHKDSKKDIENRQNQKFGSQKNSALNTAKIKQRNSSKVLIENLLVKRSATLTKSSQRTINWCAALEASNALDHINSNNKPSSLIIGAGMTSRGRTTVQRMIALRSLLG